MLRGVHVADICADEFAVFPGIHGEDVPYTFANGNNPSIANLAIATAMQEYFTSFAINGVPKGQGIPRFPLYGAGSDAIEFNATSIHDIRDESANSRCLWWQKALYY
jgi:carboxylesterase type B